MKGVTLNVLIGNGDAHGKNFSLLHDPSGALQLAPFYDLMSTVTYGDDQLAMYVDDVRRTDRVTAERIVNEAVKWGMSRRRAAEIVEDVSGRAPEAAEAARRETKELPASVSDTVDSQLARVRSALTKAT